MTDNDLTALLAEVNFATPDKVEEKPRAVLLNEGSLTQKSHFSDDYNERGTETIPLSQYAINSNIMTNSLGTSPSISFEDKKKYKLLCVNNSESHCRAVLTQGSSFCTNVNCTIKHKNSERIPLVDNCLYVQKSSEKSRSTAFTEPNISTLGLNEEVLETWSQSLKTLKQWT